MRARDPGEEETTSHVNEATDWSCVLRTSGLLPVAEHFVDVLQAQQAQLAESSAASLPRNRIRVTWQLRPPGGL